MEQSFFFLLLMSATWSFTLRVKWGIQASGMDMPAQIRESPQFSSLPDAWSIPGAGQPHHRTDLSATTVMLFAQLRIWPPSISERT